MKLAHAVTHTILIAALAAGAPFAALAQNINERKTTQQDRIAQGARSGQLTAGETARLEHQEAGINHEERNMRARDHGNLTRHDRKTLRRQQNKESRRIFCDKHNRARR